MVSPSKFPRYKILEKRERAYGVVTRKHTGGRVPHVWNQAHPTPRPVGPLPPPPPGNPCNPTTPRESTLALPLPGLWRWLVGACGEYVSIACGLHKLDYATMPIYCDVGRMSDCLLWLWYFASLKPRPTTISSMSFSQIPTGGARRRSYSNPVGVQSFRLPAGAAPPKNAALVVLTVTGA